MELADEIWSRLSSRSKREVLDASGSGGTVTSMTAVAMTPGLVHHDASGIANRAAGLADSRPGTAASNTKQDPRGDSRGVTVSETGCFIPFSSLTRVCFLIRERSMPCVD